MTEPAQTHTPANSSAHDPAHTSGNAAETAGAAAANAAASTVAAANTAAFAETAAETAPAAATSTVAAATGAGGAGTTATTNNNRTLWRWTFHLFVPLLALVGLRAWLASEAEQRPAAFAIEPVMVIDSVWDLVWPWLLGLAALVAAGFAIRWALRRWGGAPLGRVLLGLWWLACALGMASALRSHWNKGQLQAAAPVQAQVIGMAEKAASARGPGGATLFVQSSAWPQPQRVFIEGEAARTIAPGSTLALQLAQGRRSGSFVTGWQLLSTPPASTATPATPASPAPDAPPAGPAAASLATSSAQPTASPAAASAMLLAAAPSVAQGALPAAEGAAAAPPAAASSAGQPAPSTPGQ